MGVLAGGRSRAELAGAVAGQLFSVFIGGCQLNTQLPASSILLVIPNRDVKINFFSISCLPECAGTGGRAGGVELSWQEQLFSASIGGVSLLSTALSKNLTEPFLNVRMVAFGLSCLPAQ